MIGGFAAVLLSVCPRQDPKNPDLHFNKDLGISLQKPAGNEDWSFKAGGGRVQGARVAVVHARENISIEVVVLLPTSDSYDPKRAAEDEYTQRVADGAWKEVRRRKLEDMFLPNKGAGGIRAWYVEMLMRDKDDKFTEWRQWNFVGRENRCLYKVCVVGGEGAYEKLRKDADSILGSIKIWRLPKK